MVRTDMNDAQRNDRRIRLRKRRGGLASNRRSHGHCWLGLLAQIRQPERNRYLAGLTAPTADDNAPGKIRLMARCQLASGVAAT